MGSLATIYGGVGKKKIILRINISYILKKWGESSAFLSI